VSPTPSQLLRPTIVALASLEIADRRGNKQRRVHTKHWRNWLSHVSAARFGVYHSLEVR
jgi:hypothetical protein